MEHFQARERGLMDIGRTAKESGVSAKMIRHYETIGLLPKVARTFANYRVYRPNDVHTLRFIRRARALGFSMDDVRELVGLWHNKARRSGAVKKIAAGHVDELKTKIRELQGMLQVLEHLMRHCHGDHRPECPILEDLAKP